MHIVYTIGSLQNAGGVERVLINKANYLVANGYQITILIAQQENGKFAYPVSGLVQIIYMNINRVDSFLTRIPVFGFFLKILKLKSIYEKIIQRLAPDIIINVERGFEDFILPNLRPHIPCIRESHLSLKAAEIKDQNSKSSITNRVFTLLYTRQLKKFDQVVLLTEEDRLYRNFKNGKIVIPNLISKFSIEPDYHLDSTNAISVGRLDQYKNFKDQIIVWHTIVDQYPEWTLEIYGEGPEKENLQELINNLKLNNNVFLRGNSISVEKHLKKSSLFLFTSIAEGFGMVLVEAMQMGLPVISYRCPCGPADIITHGADGFLVDVGDRSTFSEEILKLIADPQLRKTMSEAALLKSRKFSTEEIMPQWINLFKNLVHDRA